MTRSILEGQGEGCPMGKTSQLPEIEPLTCLNGNDHAATESITEAFQVRDAASANWLVRRVLEARAYAEHVNTWAAGELRRARSQEQWLLARFGGQLQRWLEAELGRRTPRRRSIALPAGTVALRKLPAKLVVREQRDLLQWCRQHLPGAVRASVAAAGPQAVDLIDWTRQCAPSATVKETVSIDDVEEYIVQTGELPAGTVLVETEQRLYVK